ncbi:MAG: DUF2959 family protein [Balneolaceae bacterium]
MKYIISFNYTFLFLLLTSMLTVIACSTTGLQRSEEVQTTMQTVDNDIKFIIVQLDAIGASLNELTKPAQADMEKAFELFSENVSKIEDMEQDFDKHASEMEASGKAYFAEWDSDSQQYDNADIQRQSDQRRATLGETYDKIAQNNVGVKESFETYVSDINEIERFLSNDLTRDGIDSIRNISERVVMNGTHLKNELQSLQEAIEEARSEMRR